MNACPNCSHENRGGELVCENCGITLFRNVLLTTRVLPESDEEASQTGEGQMGWLAPDDKVFLKIPDVKQPIHVSRAQALILGRTSPNRPQQPDIDLTDFQALDKGVSNLHAMFMYRGTNIVITDIGSSNGTFVNGQRLPPHQAAVLYEGDEIRLGDLSMQIYFERSEPTMN